MSKKKKIFIGIVVSLLIVLLIVVAIIKGRSATVDGEITPDDMEVLVQKVTEEKLEETILVTGKIVPEGEQKIYKEAENGDIVKFNVKEGDKVKKGDPLFTYDGSGLEREFNAAVNARNMSQHNVTMIENQINELAKQINELKNAKVPTSTDEDGEVVFAVPNDEIRQLELERSQLAMELESAKVEVTMAQSEVNELDKLKQSLTVKSNIDGKVVKINEQEDRSEEGFSEPVIHIISNKPLKVIGTMSEYDSVKIKKDQDVIIRPKVFKEREWNGKVEAVSEFPTDDGSGEMDFYGGGDMNVTMYPFTVLIEDDTKELRQGFHVSLEVNVGGSEKKLAVPHVAIMDELMLGMDDDYDPFVDEFFGTGGDSFDEGMQFVYVLVDGILERRDIETGKMSDEFVEIISGVSLGELVVINPTPDMYDGMEVISYDQVD